MDQDIADYLKKLGIGVARGVPQLASGFVDLAALPFTATGMMRPEDAIGSTDWMTSKRYLPPKQPGLLSETAELLSGAINPATAIKSGLLGIGAIAGAKGAKNVNNYLVSTPKNPNPVVGTRYDTEFTGGLLDKTPVNYEDYLGSSSMIMPWDSTSRNVKVNSVSDIDLPNKSITHGGGDYARDTVHQGAAVPIAGASNRAIANRIQNRETQAIKENLEAGGSGKIIHLPTTMGDFAENFSVQPTNILLGIIDKAGASKDSLKELNNSIKNYVLLKEKPNGTMEKTFPFKNFKGVETEAGRSQLYDPAGGELRKRLVNRMYLRENQQTFGYNAQDLINAIIDPSLKGVPKGFSGNTVIEGTSGGMVLTPSKNPTYDTDFSGVYKGSLGQSVPVEILMPKTFDKISKEFAGKRGDMRTNVLGAMEKRGENISELIDDQVLQSIFDYLKANPIR